MLAEKGLYPNVDFYAATVYHYLGIPTDLFTPVFSVCRMAGWTAHVIEQHADNRLIRPDSEYIGERGLTWIPLRPVRHSARGSSPPGAPARDAQPREADRRPVPARPGALLARRCAASLLGLLWMRGGERDVRGGTLVIAGVLAGGGRGQARAAGTAGGHARLAAAPGRRGGIRRARRRPAGRGTGLPGET